MSSSARRPPPAIMLAVLGLGMMLFAPLRSVAQLPASLKVELTPERVEVGDRVTATLTLVWMGEAPANPARFPSWQESWGKAEILDVGTVDAFIDQSGRHIYRQELQLIVFEVGEVVLPKVSAAVPLADETVDVESSDPITVKVTSVLPQEPSGEPLEPRPALAPRQLDRGDLALWASVALGIALFGAAFMWSKRAAMSLVQPHLRVVLDPLPELEQHLGGIRLDDGAELAHTTLSHAFRLFLGRSLVFPAVESTTSQIKSHLRTSGIPANDAIESMRILQACDLVKFARREVEPAITADRISTVRSLGQRVHNHLSIPEDSNEGALRS